MTTFESTTAAALEPLRAQLLAQARSEADDVEASAAAEGRVEVRAAQARAEAVLGEARDRGRADGAVRLAADRARTQRAARSMVLTAQHEAYDDLRSRARDAVRELLEDPGRREALSCSLRGRLGEGAVVEDHPDGGLVARGDDGRLVDASVAALVEAALSGVDLRPLWAPA